jgi:hypothetical protein
LEESRAEAQGLVGDAPVIVATGAKALDFSRHWVPGAFKERTKRRG